MRAYRCVLRTCLAALASALTVACAPMPVGTPLDSGRSAAAPEIAAGDTWTYRIRDGYTGLERGTERYRVEQVTGGNVTVLREATGAATTEVYDRNWNWLRRPATNLKAFDYSPAYRAFDFPLEPGKRWQARLTATDPLDGRRFPVRIEGKVVGWERVKVPAGEFDALKIVRGVFFDYFEFNLRGQSHIEEFEWYAPAVKQSVRREARSRYRNLQGAHDTGFVRVRGGDRDDSGPRFINDDWLVYELVSTTAR